jgi:hypothetical protein
MKVIKMKSAWCAPLVFGAVPLFFLHARTGFETVIATSWYAGFLAFYFLYRTKTYKALPTAVILAAMAFYSYAGIWLVVVVTLIAFFLLDLEYHFKHIRIVLISAIIGVLCFVPFLKFQASNPDSIHDHLTHYQSYLTRPTPLNEKITTFAKNYIDSFSPSFLFIYQDTYQIRHALKGYGYFPLWSLPLVILGILYALYTSPRWLKGLLLATTLISPLGGVVIEPSPTRSLPLVIPMVIFMGFGIKAVEKFILSLAKNASASFKIFTASLFIVVFLANTLMAYDSVVNGPLWYTDYGLYGMQYGAKPLFEKVNQALDRYDSVMVTPDFTNGTDILPGFFLSAQKLKRVKLGNGTNFSAYRSLSGKKTAFILPLEYEKLVSLGYNDKITIIDTIYAPDLTPAFYQIIYKNDFPATIQ